MKLFLTTLLAALLTSCFVQQNLNVSYQLTPGMTKADVEKIMGPPVKSDFKQNVEEWHYCRTGIDADEFLALFFYEGKLVEKLNYTVTVADTKGVGGSCQKFIKMGNYREPDSIVEIRLR